MFRYTLSNFHYTGATHVKIEWVEHAFEKLGHLCHLCVFLFCLIKSKFTKATGTTKSKETEKVLSPHFYDPHRGMCAFLLSSEQRFVVLNYFRSAINF